MKVTNMHTAIRALNNEPGNDFGRLLGHLEFSTYSGNYYLGNDDNPKFTPVGTADFERLKEGTFSSSSCGSRVVFNETVEGALNGFDRWNPINMHRALVSDAVYKLRFELVEVDSRDVFNVNAKLERVLCIEVCRQLPGAYLRVISDERIQPEDPAKCPLSKEQIMTCMSRGSIWGHKKPAWLTQGEIINAIKEAACMATGRWSPWVLKKAKEEAKAYDEWLADNPLDVSKK